METENIVDSNWLDLLFPLNQGAPVEPVTPKVQAKPEERHYWRCPDCLSVCATTGPLNKIPRDINWHGYGPGIKCALCDVRLDYMGKVDMRARYLIQTEERCACNEKCQSATGPNCSCSCGGANHGTAMFVTVVVSQSDIPEVTPIDGKATARRDEYRAAYAAAKERIEWAYRAMQRRRNGDYLPDQLYWPAREAIEALGRADNRAQHGPRLKALALVGVKS